MSAILLVIVFGILYRIKIKDNPDYLTKKNTTQINGVFIVLVFYRHIIEYVSFENFIDKPMVIIDHYLSQLIVTTFLFYSGYGIMESIKNKKKYVSSIPKNRILKTLILYDICVLFYLIINLCFNNIPDIKKVLLSLLTLDTLGNSNWYILSILVMWLCTYISFLIFKKRYNIALITMAILTILYIIIGSIFKIPQYYYNTIFCYVLGMLYSYNSNKLNEFIKNNKKWLIITLINILLFCAFAYIIVYNPYNIIVYEIVSALFVSLIVLITRKIEINNKVFQYLGDNLFPIYILQRIPMIVFYNLGISKFNNYVYYICCFIMMLLLVYLYNKTILKTVNYIYNKNRSKQG